MHVGRGQARERANRQVARTGHVESLPAVPALPPPAGSIPSRLTAIASAVSLAIPCMAFAADDAVMEEIIVTATRRAMTLQETPFNISAISGEELDQAGVVDFGDLLRRIPGVAYLDQGTRVGGNNPNIILRGINANSMIGSFDFPNVAVAPISVYVNDTPVYFPVRLDDLERVEVLRGPQGTLYGSGSMGGTLKILTRRPDPAGFTTDVRVGTHWTENSDEQSYNLSGTLNVPLSDALSLRLNAGYDRAGGFIDARGRYELDGNGAATVANQSDPVNSLPNYRTEDDISDMETRSARVALRFQPNDGVDAVLTYHNQSDESDGRQIQNPFHGSGEDYVEYHPTPEPYERDAELATLEVDVDFGFATLTSATSYYDNESDQSIDYTDFWAVNVEPYYYSAFPRVVSPERSITDDEGFVQEIRLRSNGTGNLDWLVGGFYSDVNNAVYTTYEVPGSAAWNNLPRNPGDPPPYYFANNTDVNAIFDREIDVTDKALFGEITYRPTDRWQLTGGARASWVDFEQDLVEFLPQCGYYCSSDGVDPNGAVLSNVEEEDSDVTFKLNTSYDLSDNLMLYATWIEGYRRGGGNVALLTHPFLADPPELLTFEPDSAQNWEVGIKGQLHNRIQFTLAGYYVDWDEPQIDSYTPFGNPAVVNANGASTRGIEFEAFGTLSENLQFSFGYAYTDAELTDDFATPDGGVGRDGESLPGVPRHIATMTLDYTQSLSGTMFSEIRYHLNGFYRSGANADFEGSIRFFEVDSFSLWDLSATLHPASGNWSVTAFVDNLFDEAGITGGIPATRNGPIGQFYFVTRPRSYGLRLTYHYE